jgi:hypothetical protein
LKTNIKTAPVAIYNNWLTRRYGNANMAAGYLDALEYARVCHYDVDPFVPTFGPMAAEIRATIDEATYYRFVNAHAETLRMERACEEKWQSLREYMKGPGAAEVAAKNQAAHAADVLEIEIRQRAEQIMRDRAVAAERSALGEARKQAMADAKAQLGGAR